MRMAKWIGGGAVLVAAALFAGCVEYGAVQSNSMFPYLQAGPTGKDRFLVETLGPRLGLVARGDVVTFADPRSSGKTMIKRVVGLPGERIEIRDGAVWIDGARWSPPAEAGRVRYVRTGDGEWRVPEGHVFLLGDNSRSSVDSRVYGSVPSAGIQGRLLARLGK
jgi:signal peptidase I